MALLTARHDPLLALRAAANDPRPHADPWSIARPLLMLIVAPLAAGMVVKSCAATFAARAAPVLAKIGNAALLLLFVLLVALNLRCAPRRHWQRRDPRRAALFRRRSSCSAGCSAARTEVRGVLGLATAARNFGAALAPAENSFDDPKVTVMIIVGAIVCLVVSFLAAGWLRRNSLNTCLAISATTRSHAKLRQHAMLAILMRRILLTACAGLPKGGERTPSTALKNNGGTALAAAVRPRVAAHPGQSGLHALADARDALAARLVLADAAQRSLDVQYFIWNKDMVGKVMIERLFRAADRGVRVRLLLDDLGTMPSDAVLLAIDSHPNIEVRMFNPVAMRSLRMLGMVADFARINKRMHNKSFIADGQVAIVGGRNIGDEYFDAHAGANFADLDVAVIGPVVKEVSDAFDLYWNHQAAVPIAALSRQNTTPEKFAEKRAALVAHHKTAKESAYADTVRDSEFARQLRNRAVPSPGDRPRS